MYIRTNEDKIIKIDENGCIKEFNIFGKKMLFAFKDKKYSYRFENGKLVANQSENLAELCDEFVLIERNAKPIIFKTLQGAINNKIYDDEIIYGAIWTDKGLQFVARMNSKGELELK